MDGILFVLKSQHSDDIKRLSEDETRRLMIDIIKLKDLYTLEKGDTIVRLIENGNMIEVKKISKISYYDILKL